MNCPFCGNEIQQGAKFCGKCGAQIPQTTQAPQTPVTPPPVYVPPTPPPVQSSALPPQYIPVPPPGPQIQITQPGPQTPITPPPQYMPVTPQTAENNASVESAASGFASKLKSASAKKLLVIAGSIVLIIIALVIILPMLGGTGGAGISDNISFFSSDDTVLVSGNNNPKFTIDGKLHSSQISMDCSKAVLMTDYNSSSGGTLWFVTTTTSVKIAEDVHAYQIANSGSGVVYLTDYDNRDNIAALYLYDTGSKSSARITDEAMYLGYGSPTGVCISPNGKSVSYISDYDESSRELTGYLKLDGKSVEKLGDGMFALVLSDGGKHIYYAKMTKDGYGASLHVRSGSNDNRLIAELSDYDSNLILNRDYSQVIFNLDGRSYISQNGSERTKICNSTIDGIIVARGTQTGYNYGDTGSIYVYGISTFANTLAASSNGVLLIDSRYEAAKVPRTASYAYNTTVSSDGRTLLSLLDSGDLVSIDPTNPNAQSREIADYVANYIATADLKTIYYVTHDEELWCVKGNAAPVKISDDVSSSHLALAGNSAKVFFLVDYGSSSGGTLYYSDNGGAKARVSGGDDVASLWSTYTSVFYVNYDSELYRSGGNESFSLFMEDYR